MTVPNRSTITDAFLLLLRSSTGQPIGDHTAPSQAEMTDEEFFPYAIVYSIEGGELTGPPLSAPEADGEFVYQVTSVGTTRKQAEWMADRARRTVLARTSGQYQVEMVSPAGTKIRGRIPDGGAGPVDVEGEEPNEIYSVPERFRILTTPG